MYAFDDFQLDLEKLELTRGGKPTRTNTLTLRLLGVLVQNAGQIVTKQELLDRVWDGRVVSDNVVTVAMARLRRSLGYQGGERDIVVSVHGRGYRFVRDVTQVDASASAKQSGPPARLTGTPFVGREGVLGHLHAALSDAHSASGCVIMLTGEAGIGKTRAAEMFAREAEASDVPVAWGRCREVGDTPPLWPFSELLRDVFMKTQLVPTDPRLASVQSQLFRLLPELATASGAPDEPAALSGKLGRKHRIFDAVARTLGLASEHGPCVLVLDDLHRADPASLELVHYLVDEITRTKLLLVATLREKTGPVNEPLARVLGHRNATRIALPRLSETHVGHYLEALLGSPSRALCRAVFKNSEGNPFFMTELARQLRVNDAADLNRIAVPDAALDVVRQRVAGLDDAARGALSCAAVIGRNFSLPVLQVVSGSDHQSLMASLDSAIAIGVVLPKTDSLTEFVFAHELVRSVLYDAMAPADRRSCHLRVASAFEQRATHGDLVAPADLAFHSRAALPAGDLRKTIRYCIDAATAAAHVFSYADAARSLQHALETLDMLEKPSPRMRLDLLLHQALFTRPQSTRAFQPLIARVVQLALEHNQGNVLARAAMLHDPYPGLQPLPGAVRAFEDALALLQREGGEPSLLAAVLSRLATSAPLCFDAAASGAQLERAVAVAKNSSELLDQFSVRSAQLYLHGGPARHERNQQLLGELQNLCRANAVVLSVPPVMLEVYRAVHAFQDGELDSVHAALERGGARCRDLDSELLWQFERFSALTQLQVAPLNQAEDARRALRALHERAHKQAIFGTELFSAFDAAVIFRQRDPQLSAALEPDDHDRPNIWSLKLRALQAAGQRAEARAALERVPAARLAALPCDRDYLGTLGALTRAALDLRALDYAEALYTLLEPYPQHFAVNVSFFCEGSVSLLLGQLAHALGRDLRARDHLREAVTHSERAGLPNAIQHAQSELARLESALTRAGLRHNFD